MDFYSAGSDLSLLTVVTAHEARLQPEIAYALHAVMQFMQRDKIF
jgi:hypothetical protein